MFFRYLGPQYPRSGVLRQTIDCKASQENTQEKPEGIGRWLKAAPDQTAYRIPYSWSLGLSLHLVAQDLLRDGQASPHLESKGKMSRGSLKRDYRILVDGEPLKRVFTASLRLIALAQQPYRVTLASA